MSETLITPTRHWLLSDAAARELRSLLTGDALHLLESSLHATDALPADEVGPEMTAQQFSVHFLQPLGRLADRAGLVGAAIVAQVDDTGDGGFTFGDRASVTQLGEGAFARSAVYDLVRDLADTVR